MLSGEAPLGGCTLSRALLALCCMSQTVFYLPATNYKIYNDLEFRHEICRFGNAGCVLCAVGSCPSLLGYLQVVQLLVQRDSGSAFQAV